MNLLKHRTIIDAENKDKNTVAEIIINTDGTFYQDELRQAIVKVMNKHYTNVFVEVQK